MSRGHRKLILMLAVGATGALCACKSQRKSSSPLPAARAAPASPSTAEADARSRGLRNAPPLRPIPFEFDSYSLGPFARERLSEYASLLRRNSGWEALLEGHCDDQGSDAYNLALGQRRAKAARDYLLMSGVPASRVATISFGEEKPVCREAAEDCRGRNRRAEIRVMTGVAKDKKRGPL